MAKMYGYLSKDVRLNNPSYLVWKDRPVGENVFFKFKKVELCKPTKHETQRLQKIARRDEMPYFVVKIDGHRVYLSRSSLLTEDEYHEARHTEDQEVNAKKARRRAKLALLKNSARGVAKDST